MAQRLFGCWLLLFLTTGCSHSTSVSGSVTIDGKELDKGFITFFPEREVKNTAGAEIINGRYHVAEITPGKKRVFIAAAPVPKVKEGKIHLLPPITPIPPDASGNNQIIEIVSGNQTHDFKLENAKR